MSWSQDAGPVSVASLVSPEDGERLARFRKQDIEWRGSGAKPAAYAVESQYGNPANGMDHWSAPVLTLVKVPADGDVSKMPMPFGVGMQPHRWRVWTVGKDGVVVVSEWRRVNFTN